MGPAPCSVACARTVLISGGPLSPAQSNHYMCAPVVFEEKGIGVETATTTCVREQKHTALVRPQQPTKEGSKSARMLGGGSLNAQ